MFGVALLLCIAGACLAAEPSCSPFDYEEKLLSKMIRQEFIYEKLKDEILAFKNEVKHEMLSVKDKVANEFKSNEIEREVFKNNVNDEMLAVKDKVANELESIENERKVFKNEVNDAMLAVKDKVANELKSIENEREVFNNKVSEERQAHGAILKEMVDNTTKQINMKIEEVQKLKDTFGADKVAFLAKDVSDTTPSNDQTFVFTTTLFNEGDGYDSDTGMFTAPTGGLYKFDIQLCLGAGSSIYIYFAIMADNKKIQGGFYRDYDTSKCYSATALVRLESGGKVWVKCESGGCNGSMWQHAYSWNTFSGFRLNA